MVFVRLGNGPKGEFEHPKMQIVASPWDRRLVNTIRNVGSGTEIVTEC